MHIDDGLQDSIGEWTDSVITGATNRKHVNELDGVSVPVARLKRDAPGKNKERLSCLWRLSLYHPPSHTVGVLGIVSRRRVWIHAL